MEPEITTKIMQKIREEIAALAEAVRKLDQRFDTVDKRFDTVDKNFEILKRDLGAVALSFIRVSEQIHQRFSGHDDLLRQHGDELDELREIVSRYVPPQPAR